MNAQANKRLWLRNIVWIAVITLATGTSLFAQAGRGGINGLISDPTGAIVPGVKVTALSHTTGIALSTVTNAAGLYSFMSLNPGPYEVTASRKGFESVAQDNVTVSVDQVSSVNIALSVGSIWPARSFEPDCLLV